MKKLLFYSLMFLLAACGGDSDNGQTVPPGGQPVSKVGVLLSVDKNYINADGEDAASFRILFTDDKGFTYDIGDQAELLCNGEKIQFLVARGGRFLFQCRLQQLSFKYGQSFGRTRYCFASGR